MQNTIPVYYQDPLLRELSVQILSVSDTEKGVAVVTDQSICYPEGGGQPGDRGWLGECRIIDTQKGPDGTIVHLVEKRSSIVAGDRLSMCLDWGHRYDYMQQHTAQHLISGVFHSLAGIDTVSVHLGHEILTVETACDEISPERLRSVEDRVNEIIRKNIPVTYQVLPLKEALELNLRRPVKVDGLVRLVRIGDFDLIACGGLHVASSSEVVDVILAGTERIRGHVRTQWIAGSRAVELIHRNQCIVHELGELFSAQPQELVEKTQALQRAASDTLYQLRKAQEKLISQRLDQLVIAADRDIGFPLITIDVSQEEPQYMRFLPEAIAAYGHLALCAVQDKPDGTIAWMIVLKGNAALAIDFPQIKAYLFPLIQAKGGGRSPLWQGVGTQASGKKEFLSQFCQLARGNINVGR